MVSDLTLLAGTYAARMEDLEKLSLRYHQLPPGHPERATLADRMERIEAQLQEIDGQAELPWLWTEAQQPNAA